MMTDTGFRYIAYNEIDKDAWDNCIQTASNGLVYAYSWYLDTMTGEWDGLVLGNYEMVFPLTWRKKYGIYYLYQPAFTPQLGLFGNDLTPEIVNQALSSIPSKFKLIEISLNEGNYSGEKATSTELKANTNPSDRVVLPETILNESHQPKTSITDNNPQITSKSTNHPQHPSITILNRQNYVLPLNRSYNELISGFRQNIKRNVRKARELGCTYSSTVQAGQVIELSKGLMKQKTNLTDKDYDRFLGLFNRMFESGHALVRGVYGNTGELLASAIFFMDEQRIYYILGGNHPNGKTLGASHLLMASFIEEFAGKPYVLDFEGSSIPGLAFFYESFGSELKLFPAVRIDRLPWWIKLIRKG